jgi:hypothetical protein
VRQRTKQALRFQLVLHLRANEEEKEVPRLSQNTNEMQLRGGKRESFALGEVLGVGRKFEKLKSWMRCDVQLLRGRIF